MSRTTTLIPVRSRDGSPSRDSARSPGHARATVHSDQRGSGSNGNETDALPQNADRMLQDTTSCRGASGALRNNRRCVQVRTRRAPDSPQRTEQQILLSPARDGTQAPPRAGTSARGGSPQQRRSRTAAQSEATAGEAKTENQRRPTGKVGGILMSELHE